MPRYYKKRKYVPRRKYGRKSQVGRAQPFGFSHLKSFPQRLRKTGQYATKLAKTALGLLNVEYKVFDATANVRPDFGSPTVTLINPIEQGDSSSNRNGDSVRLKQFLLQGTIRKNGADTGSLYNLVRVCVVRSEVQATTTAPTQADLFTSTNTYSFRNLLNTKNLTMLYDKVFKVEQQNSTIIKNFRIKIPLNFRFKWNSGFSATVPKNNALYLVTWATGYTTTYYPYLDYQSRLRYIDN